MVNPVQIPEGLTDLGHNTFKVNTPRGEKIKELGVLLYPRAGAPSLTAIPPEDDEKKEGWYVGLGFEDDCSDEFTVSVRVGDAFEEAEKAVLHEVCERLRDRAVTLRTAAEEAEALL